MTLLSYYRGKLKFYLARRMNYVLKGAFCVTSAIFQATLLLFCYFSLVSINPGKPDIVDVLDVFDWQRLADLCDLANGGEDHTRNMGRSPGETLLTPQERYIVDGTGSAIRVKGFFEGNENQLDVVRYGETFSCRGGEHR